MDLIWQSDKEVPSIQGKPAMSGLRNQKGLLNILLLLGLLLAFVPLCDARQRGSSPVVRHVSSIQCMDIRIERCLHTMRSAGCNERRGNVKLIHFYFQSGSFGSSPGCTSEPSLRILKYLDRWQTSKYSRYLRILKQQQMINFCKDLWRLLHAVSGCGGAPVVQVKQIVMKHKLLVV